jgi:hypothetical protein
MPEIALTVNEIGIVVKEGTTVAAAVLIAGVAGFRRSVTGEPRGPLCGMGICYECRVTINGDAHARSCQIVCKPGMQVVTA